MPVGGSGIRGSLGSKSGRSKFAKERSQSSGFNSRHLYSSVPPCWELRRYNGVLGRLYLRTREDAWFVCAFEPMASFKSMEKSLRYNFREVSSGRSHLPAVMLRASQVREKCDAGHVANLLRKRRAGELAHQR